MGTNNGNFVKILLTIFLIVLATSPAFALGENNRNLLLIGLMMLSPVIVVYYQQFRKEDFLLLLFLLALIICPSLFHSTSMRWSTVLYTAMYCLTFMGVTLLVRNCDFKIVNYIQIIKYLIYAYAAVLLIQQFCVLMKLPIFSVSNYVPHTPWKLNSLTSEPSHTGQIIGTLMYSYILMREKWSGIQYSFKENKLVSLCFLWIMLTSISGTALLFLFIISIRFIRLRSFLMALTIGIVCLILIDYFQFESYERIKKVTLAVLTLSESNIVNVDHSASFRIVPMMRYIQMIDFSSWDTWFGHGIDYIQNRFSYMFVGVEKEAMAHGGLLIMLIDHGVIPFILFSLFSIRFSIRKNEIQSYLLWFLIVLSSPINVQILWFGLIFFWINNYFYTIPDEESVKQFKEEQYE